MEYNKKSRVDENRPSKVPANFFRLFVNCEMSETLSSNEMPEEKEDSEERGLACRCLPVNWESFGKIDWGSVVQDIILY